MKTAPNLHAVSQTDLLPHTQTPQSQEATTVLDFDEYHLLVPLFGENDSHLTRIEQVFEATISSMGNRVGIAAPSECKAELAAKVILELYARLQNGQDVEMGDVNGVIRMVQDANQAEELDRDPAPDLQIMTKKRVVRPRTAAQAHYVQAIRDHDLVFGLGPAGTGKTYLAVAVAVEQLITGAVDRIILSRPAVEAGERLGFLPGDMKEKIDPYLRPLYDALYDTMPGEVVEKKLERHEIEIAPLAFMRGRTLSNAMIIVDEAQNTTAAQMKMLLTRMGEGSRMIVTGDLSQMDLPRGTMSGLEDAVNILEGLKGVNFVRFSNKDVVRHSLVTRIVQAYDRHDQDLQVRRERIKAREAAEEA